MAEIEYRTPNGLDDACRVGFTVDYSKAALRLEIDWFLGVSGRGMPNQRSEWKRGILQIEGLQYFVIKPPRNGLIKFRDYSPDQISGYETSDKEIFLDELPDASANAFRHNLYLGCWESFIYFAGTSASVSSADLIVREMSAD